MLQVGLPLGSGPRVGPQDENAVQISGIKLSGKSSGFSVLGQRGPLDENAGMPFGLKGGASGKQPLQQTNGSVRRALGNITNVGVQGNTDNGPGLVKKQVGGKDGTRRAFGDITNSGPTLKPSGGVLKSTKPLASEPGGAVKQPSMRHVPLPTTTSLAAPLLPTSSRLTSQQRKADSWALEGIERPAGKTWRELEAERIQKRDQDMNQRMKLLAHTMSRSMIQVLPDICASSNSASSSCEDDMQLALTPEPVMPCIEPLEEQDPTSGDLLLPGNDSLLDLLPAGPEISLGSLDFELL